MAEQMVRYKCMVCRYVYDPTAGVPPGVEFEALPDDGVCPECMVGKGQFVMVEG